MKLLIIILALIGGMFPILLNLFKGYYSLVVLNYTNNGVVACVVCTNRADIFA